MSDMNTVSKSWLSNVVGEKYAKVWSTMKTQKSAIGGSCEQGAQRFWTRQSTLNQTSSQYPTIFID